MGITYNGVTSESCGIVVEHYPGYSMAERDYEMIHVDGRNGDLLIDKNSYRNVKRSYDIAFGSLYSTDYGGMAGAVAKFLNPAPGYHILEDEYEPNVYRIAAFKGPVDLSNIMMHAGRATIDFDCKPQRFLKTGLTPISVGGLTTTIQNTTYQIANPTIRIEGNGTIYIGDSVVIVHDLEEGEYVIIDTENQEVYAETRNMISYVNMSSLPVLLPGSNSINCSTIAAVSITPNWWVL